MIDFLTGLVPQFVWDWIATWQLAVSVWPWLAITTVAGMVIATWLGPQKTLVLLTGGIVVFFLARQKAQKPDWESGETRVPPGGFSPHGTEPPFRIPSKPKVRVRTSKRSVPYEPPKGLT